MGNVFNSYVKNVYLIFATNTNSRWYLGTCVLRKNVQVVELVHKWTPLYESIVIDPSEVANQTLALARYFLGLSLCDSGLGSILVVNLFCG